MTVRQRTGTYRHKLTIQKLGNAATELDSRGQTSSPSWITVAVVRASLTPLSGNEAFQVRQQSPGATHLIRTHYVPNVDARCRATFGTRTFHFQDVRNLEERGRALEIIATEDI